MIAARAMTIEDYATACGQVRVTALRAGGEPLLDRVESILYPASSLIARVRVGQISLVPGVERDIQMAIDDAKHLIEPGRT